MKTLAGICVFAVVCALLGAAGWLFCVLGEVAWERRHERWPARELGAWLCCCAIPAVLVGVARLFAALVAFLWYGGAC